MANVGTKDRNFFDWVRSTSFMPHNQDDPISEKENLKIKVEHGGENYVKTTTGQTQADSIGERFLCAKEPNNVGLMSSLSSNQHRLENANINCHKQLNTNTTTESTASSLKGLPIKIERQDEYNTCKNYSDVDVIRQLIQESIDVFKEQEYKMKIEERNIEEKELRLHKTEAEHAVQLKKTKSLTTKNLLKRGIDDIQQSRKADCKKVKLEYVPGDNNIEAKLGEAVPQITERLIRSPDLQQQCHPRSPISVSASSRRDDAPATNSSVKTDCITVTRTELDKQSPPILSKTLSSKPELSRDTSTSIGSHNETSSLLNMTRVLTDSQSPSDLQHKSLLSNPVSASSSVTKKLTDRQSHPDILHKAMSSIQTPTSAAGVVCIPSDTSNLQPKPLSIITSSGVASVMMECQATTVSCPAVIRKPTKRLRRLRPKLMPSIPASPIRVAAPAVVSLVEASSPDMEHLEPISSVITVTAPAVKPPATNTYSVVTEISNERQFLPDPQPKQVLPIPTLITASAPVTITSAQATYKPMKKQNVPDHQPKPMLLHVIPTVITVAAPLVNLPATATHSVVSGNPTESQSQLDLQYKPVLSIPTSRRVAENTPAGASHPVVTGKIVKRHVRPKPILHSQASSKCFGAPFDNSPFKAGHPIVTENQTPPDLQPEPVLSSILEKSSTRDVAFIGNPPAEASHSTVSGKQSSPDLQPQPLLSTLAASYRRNVISVDNPQAKTGHDPGATGKSADRQSQPGFQSKPLPSIPTSSVHVEATAPTDYSPVETSSPLMMEKPSETESHSNLQPQPLLSMLETSSKKVVASVDPSIDNHPAGSSHPIVTRKQTPPDLQPKSVLSTLETSSRKDVASVDNHPDESSHPVVTGKQSPPDLQPKPVLSTLETLSRRDVASVDNHSDESSHPVVTGKQSPPDLQPKPVLSTLETLSRRDVLSIEDPPSEASHPIVIGKQTPPILQHELLLSTVATSSRRNVVSVENLQVKADHPVVTGKWTDKHSQPGFQSKPLLSIPSSSIGGTILTKNSPDETSSPLVAGTPTGRQSVPEIQPKPILPSQTPSESICAPVENSQTEVSHPIVTGNQSLQDPQRMLSTLTASCRIDVASVDNSQAKTGHPVVTRKSTDRQSQPDFQSKTLSPIPTSIEATKPTENSPAETSSPLEPGILFERESHSDRQPKPLLHLSTTTRTIDFIYKPSTLEKFFWNYLQKSKCYKCPYCRETFSNLCSVIVHVRLIHTLEKPYVCCHCDSSTAHYATMLEHIITTHFDRCALHICKHSEKYFYKEPIQGGTDELEVYQCGVCNTQSSFSADVDNYLYYYNAQNLLLIVTHVELDPFLNTFVCPHCGEAWKSWSSKVKDHTCKMTDVDKLFCPQCCYGSKHPFIMVMHMRDKHGIKYDENILVEKLIGPLRVPPWFESDKINHGSSSSRPIPKDQRAARKSHQTVTNKNSSHVTSKKAAAHKIRQLTPQLEKNLNSLHQEAARKRAECSDNCQTGPSPVSVRRPTLIARSVQVDDHMSAPPDMSGRVIPPTFVNHNSFSNVSVDLGRSTRSGQPLCNEGSIEGMQETLSRQMNVQEGEFKKQRTEFSGRVLPDAGMLGRQVIKPHGQGDYQNSYNMEDCESELYTHMTHQRRYHSRDALQKDSSWQNVGIHTDLDHSGQHPKSRQNTAPTSYTKNDINPYVIQQTARKTENLQNMTSKQPRTSVGFPALDVAQQRSLCTFGQVFKNSFNAPLSQRHESYPFASERQSYLASQMRHSGSHHPRITGMSSYQSEQTNRSLPLEMPAPALPSTLQMAKLGQIYPSTSSSNPVNRTPEFMLPRQTVSGREGASVIGVERRNIGLHPQQSPRALQAQIYPGSQHTNYGTTYPSCSNSVNNRIPTLIPPRQTVTEGALLGHSAEQRAVSRPACHQYSARAAQIANQGAPNPWSSYNVNNRTPNLTSARKTAEGSSVEYNRSEQDVEMASICHKQSQRQDNAVVGNMQDADKTCNINAKIQKKKEVLPVIARVVSLNPDVWKTVLED